MITAVGHWNGEVVSVNFDFVRFFYVDRSIIERDSCKFAHMPGNSSILLRIAPSVLQRKERPTPNCRSINRRSSTWLILNIVDRSIDRLEWHELYF